MSSREVSDASQPELINRTVVGIAYAEILAAAAMSLTLNVSFNTRHDLIPHVIAAMAGIVAPLLFAFNSHIAATVDFGDKKLNHGMRTLIGLVAAGFLYVSASAGTRILRPVMGLPEALILCVAVDVSSMICLFVLMVAEHRKTALRAWEQTAGEREILGRLATVRSDISAGRPRVTAGETVRGNGGQGAGGNGLAAGSGNGNPPRALPAGNAAEPSEGGQVASVTVVLSLEQIREAADSMAMVLAVDGEEITNAKYGARHGGRVVRYSPIVGEVKAFYAPIVAAVRERRASDPGFTASAAAGLVAEMKVRAGAGQGGTAAGPATAGAR